MIGEACRFYGWTVEYVLRMPAITFFAMLDAMRLLEAFEGIERTDEAAISICTLKHYENVRAKHLKVIEAQHSTTKAVEPGVKPEFEKPAGIVLEGEAARAAMISLFAAKKQYG